MIGRRSALILLFVLVVPGVAAALTIERADLPPVATDDPIPSPSHEVRPANPHEDVRTPVASEGVAVDDPSVHLLAELADAVDAQELADVRAAYVRFFQTQGFAIPAASDPYLGNDSLSYTYALGDVDLDGVTDFAVDQFCVASRKCPGRPPGLVQAIPQAAARAEQEKCAPTRLVAFSGKNASVMWSWDYPVFPSDPGLAARMALLLATCFENIVATIPWANNLTGFLVYRVSGILGNSLLSLRHHFYAMDPYGRVRWTYTVDGFAADIGVGQKEINVNGDKYIVEQKSRVFVGENFTMLPYLQGAAQAGVPTLPNSTSLSLHLRHVGARWVKASTETSFCRIPKGVPGCHPGIQPMLPGTTRAPILLNAFQSYEWLTRLDPRAGTVEWTRPSFRDLTGRDLPGDRSRVVLTPSPEFAPPWIDDERYMAADAASFLYYGLPGYHYWFRGVPCCGDLDGDLTGDIVYHVIEWNAFQSTAPLELAESVVAFSGADARRLYESNLSTGGGAAALRIGQAVGDLDGDQVADILVHQLQFGDEDAWHNLTAVKGVDGTILWQRSHPRPALVLPLGTANRSHGADLAITEVYWRAWDLTNVTHTYVTVVHGRDGSEAWRARTLMSFFDILTNYLLWRNNGVPDFDDDGEGDLLLDDPVVLGDLTYVHRWKAVSGRDGSVVRNFDSTGLLSFPVRVDDITGDGHEDLCMLTGDFIDLWINCRNGQDATATWSRRIMEPRLASHLALFPRLQLTPLQNISNPHSDLLVNLQLTAFTVGGGVFSASTNNQLAVLRGSNGTIAWSLPQVWGTLLSERLGDSPATDRFFLRFEAPRASAMERAAEPLGDITLSLAALVVPFTALHLASRRRKP